MSFLPLDSEWTGQPQQFVRVDRNKPLSRGFFGGFYNPEHPDLRFEKMSTGGLPIVAGAAGKSFLSASATAEPSYSGTYSPETSGLTVLVVARRDGLQPDSGFGMAVTLAQVSGTQDPFHLFIKDSGERIRINTTTEDSSLQAETATDWPVGVVQTGVYAWSSGSAIDFYRNGKKQALSNNDYGSGPSGILKPAQKLRINLSALRFNGAVFRVLIWGRKLSESEIRSATENPDQILEDEEDYLFLPTGGGSTLNASASGGDTASGSADLAAQVALAAVGVSTASGAGNLAASIPLSAVGFAVAGGSADATATVTISAASLAQAAGQAGLSASVLLAGAGAAQAAGNAALVAQLNALASGAAQSGGSANLTGGAPGDLSASGGNVASGSAVLSVTVGLVATGTAQSSGAATPSATIAAHADGSAQASGTANGQAGAPGSISASGVANSSGQASWSALVTMTAAGFVQAMGAGSFTVTVPVSAAGQANASGQAAPTMAGLVRNFRLHTSPPQRLTRLAIGVDRLTRIYHGVSHG